MASKEIIKRPVTNRVQPTAVRDRAVTLYSQGHAIPDIARGIGVNPSTVRRWCRSAGAAHGSALADAPPPTSPAEILNPAPSTENQFEPAGELLNGILEPTPVERLMTAEQIMAAIGEALEKPGDAAARYQAVMVAMGLNILKTSAAMPPVVKSIKDLDTLNNMIRTNLGLNTRGSGSGGLAINLNVLTRAGTGTVTVEAEEVRGDQDDD